MNFETLPETGVTSSRRGLYYFVDSCGACDTCSAGHENYPQVVHKLPTAWAATAPSPKAASPMWSSPARTTVVRVLDGAAPLLCAVVTVYSPLTQYGLNAPGKHLGGWTRPHGRQVGQGVQGDGHGDQHVAGEARGGGRALTRSW
jgi:hypothetical protein